MADSTRAPSSERWRARVPRAADARFANRRVVLIAVAAGLAAPSADVTAQARPSTDVWVVSLRQMGNTLRLGDPRNVTNRTGYDNQPSFTPDGRSVLYTVIGDDGQADVWRFDVPAGPPVRVTSTPESEYSPTVTPDGRTFSVIRVEADSTQRLWRFPLDGGGTPSLVLERVRPVGYHAWAGDNQLALFVLGSPATLQLADVRTGDAKVVARDIGRALVKVPGRDAVTFVQQAPDSGTWLAELDVRTGATRRLMRPPPGADFHAWTPDGALITAAGSLVYQWVDNKWDQVADLGRWSVRGITRMAVSPRGDWLAFVAEDSRTP